MRIMSKQLKPRTRFVRIGRRLALDQFYWRELGRGIMTRSMRGRMETELIRLHKEIEAEESSRRRVVPRSVKTFSGTIIKVQR